MVLLVERRIRGAEVLRHSDGVTVHGTHWKEHRIIGAGGLEKRLSDCLGVLESK